MPEFLKKLFIDPSTLPEDSYGFIQVLFLGSVYGKVLYAASTLIADGSEHLLCVPEFKNIVGSVVLPLLGAIPDGVIILFSGIGPNAQETLSIGVGTLAGSTIMLLTIPWALSIIMGRVDIDVYGETNYRKPKLVYGKNSLFRSGVKLRSEIRTNAIIMCGTALLYVVIQIPAIMMSKDPSLLDTKKGMMEERNFAVAGFILAILSFAGYLIWNLVHQSTVIEDTVYELQIDALRRGIVSLKGLMLNEIEGNRTDESEEYGSLDNMSNQKLKSELRRILRKFFTAHDHNKNNLLEISEALALFRELNEEVSRADIEEFFKIADDNGDKLIDLDELVEACFSVLIKENELPKDESRPNGSLLNLESQNINEQQEANEEEEEEEDEPDFPSQLSHLPAEQQQIELKKLSFRMIAAGLLAVLVFSDPMVDVFSDLGNRLEIPGFYIAFFLAPLASNASELIAAVNYGRKKTSRSISISLSSLIGAATMNNTFGLGIFMGLIAFQGLKWEYTAEVIGILTTEFVVGFMAFRRTQRTIDALIVLCIFPTSLILIEYLNSRTG